MATTNNGIATNANIASISQYTAGDGVIKYVYKVDRIDYISYKCPTKEQIKGNYGGDFIEVPEKYADNQCVLYDDINRTLKSISLIIQNTAKDDIDCEIILYKIGSDNKPTEGPIPYECKFVASAQRTYSMSIAIDDLGSRLGIEFKNNKRAKRRLTIYLTNNDLGKIETLCYNQGDQVLTTNYIEMTYDISKMHYTENYIFESLVETSGSSLTPPGIYFIIS